MTDNDDTMVASGSPVLNAADAWRASKQSLVKLSPEGFRKVAIEGVDWREVPVVKSFSQLPKKTRDIVDEVREEVLKMSEREHRLHLMSMSECERDFCLALGLGFGSYDAYVKGFPNRSHNKTTAMPEASKLLAVKDIKMGVAINILKNNETSMGYAIEPKTILDNVFSLIEDCKDAGDTDVRLKAIKFLAEFGGLLDTKREFERLASKAAPVSVNVNVSGGGAISADEQRALKAKDDLTRLAARMNNRTQKAVVSDADVLEGEILEDEAEG